MSFAKEIDQLKRHDDTIRSKEFLKWFLINYFSIDEDNVDDFICDGSNDKGIDGVYVDNEEERIYFFQAKYRDKNNAIIGDTDLKNFTGSITQFNTKNSVDELKNNVNPALKSLIDSLELADKVNKYEKIGIFITNEKKDTNADTYLNTQEGYLELYDIQRLEHEYIEISAAEVNNSLTFSKDNISLIENGEYYIIIAPIKGIIEQITTSIKDATIFDKNVRYSLGKSNKVVNEINKTLKEEPEKTVLYHNGLTIIAAEIKKEPNKIKLKNCYIVNGCQSTMAFHNYTGVISDNAKILLKIIQTTDSTLANQITRNTNNQNPVQIRDLKSNNNFQKQLQSEFKDLEIFYEIKRGESVSFKYNESIRNDSAAQLICSFHLKKPYIAHEKAKLFREHYQEIFSNNITAKYIVLIDIMFRNINNNKPEIENIQNYKPVSYFLLYMLGQLKFRSNIADKIDKTDFQNLKDEIKKESYELYNNSLKQNFEFIIRSKINEGFFDYKNFFRNESDIHRLKEELKRDYDKDINAGRMK